MEYLENAVWVQPDITDPFTTWAIGQITLICEGLCGQKPAVAETAGSAGFCIIFGCPENNRHITEAVRSGSVDIGGLSTEGYVITWKNQESRVSLYIAGNDPAGAVYGVFALFKSLGCCFDISGDRLPEKADSMPVPRKEERGSTLNAWRGVYFQYCFATNSIMSLVDYERMFNQMAKMRMNRICYYHFPNEPFLDFTYKGERKLVGDISPGRTGQPISR